MQPTTNSGASATAGKKKSSTGSSSKTGTIVLIAALGGAAVLMAIAAAYAYNANKKKQHGGGGGNDDNGGDSTTSAYDSRPYNFYPGLNMISGVADQGKYRDSIENMASRCSTTESCVAFNDSGYFSSVILPVEQWGPVKAHFGIGYGTHVTPQADPYSELNSPDDPWVWYPGVTFAGAITPTTTAPAGTSIETLRQMAADAGYAAFSQSGALYEVVTLPKGQWPTSGASASGVYVHREHMPPDY